jgi:sterol desaturase/sphingolipid hydroxylase (fatty acid hydroxylase superfamily)
MAVTDYLVVSINPKFDIWHAVPTEVIITSIAVVIIIVVVLGLFGLMIYTCLGDAIQRGVFLGAYVVGMVLWAILILVLALAWVFCTRNDTHVIELTTIT